MVLPDDETSDSQWDGGPTPEEYLEVQQDILKEELGRWFEESHVEFGLRLAEVVPGWDDLPAFTTDSFLCAEIERCMGDYSAAAVNYGKSIESLLRDATGLSWTLGRFIEAFEGRGDYPQFVPLWYSHLRDLPTTVDNLGTLNRIRTKGAHPDERGAVTLQESDRARGVVLTLLSDLRPPGSKTPPQENRHDPQEAHPGL